MENFVYYQIALHWPERRKLEVHFTNGRIRVFRGAGVAPLLKLLSKLQVPVLFMQVGESWQHLQQVPGAYALTERQN